MTNDEYIRSKKIKKFERAWARNIEKLPRSASNAICVNDSKAVVQYYFHKVIHRDGRVLICCRKTLNTGVGAQKEYSEQEFKEIFVDAVEYDRELIRLLNNTSDDKRFLLQKEYSEAFLKYIGCDRALEKLYRVIRLSEIVDFIDKQKRTNNLAVRYFEFKKYKAKFLRTRLTTSIDRIILKSANQPFKDFCIKNKIKDFFDLLVFPYHAKCVVDYFSWGMVESVIQEVVQYIKVEKLWDTVTDEDLRG